MPPVLLAPTSGPEWRTTEREQPRGGIFTGMADLHENEIDELLSRADAAAHDMMNAYEPFESAYTAVTASSERPTEATNTTSLPRSSTVDSSSAR